jgi:hypothetical protein
VTRAASISKIGLCASGKSHQFLIDLVWIRCQAAPDGHLLSRSIAAAGGGDRLPGIGRIEVGLNTHSGLTQVMTRTSAGHMGRMVSRVGWRQRPSVVLIRSFDQRHVVKLGAAPVVSIVLFGLPDTGWICVSESHCRSPLFALLLSAGGKRNMTHVTSPPLYSTKFRMAFPFPAPAPAPFPHRSSPRPCGTSAWQSTDPGLGFCI